MHERPVGGRHLARVALVEGLCSEAEPAEKVDQVESWSAGNDAVEVLWEVLKILRC